MALNDSDLVKKLYLTEWQKASVASTMGELYQAIAKNNEYLMKEALAKHVISCYILGRRLGIEFSQLEEEIYAQVNKLRKQDSDIERLFGDYSEYERFIRNKR